MTPGCWVNSDPLVTQSCVWPLASQGHCRYCNLTGNSPSWADPAVHAKGNASACLHCTKFAFVRFCLQPGVLKAQSQICAAGIPTSFYPSPALANPALFAWSCLPCEWPHKAPTLNNCPTRFPVPAAATSWGVLTFLPQSQLSFLGGKNIQ